MPPASVEILEAAVDEAAEARAWYSDRAGFLGEAFVEELDAGISKIAENPLAWPKYVHRTRRFLLQRFPYSIVYRVVRADLVEVIAFAHARRRPGYWNARE